MWGQSAPAVPASLLAIFFRVFRSCAAVIGARTRCGEAWPIDGKSTHGSGRVRSVGPEERGTALGRPGPQARWVSAEVKSKAELCSTDSRTAVPTLSRIFSIDPSAGKSG